MKHFQPRVASPLGSSLLLKNSRVSERSTEGDRSFKVNHSFDFEGSFIDSPANKLSVLSRATAPPSHLAPAPQSSSEQIKRNYLTKVLINRMLAVRAAVKAMDSLPIKIFRKGSSFGLAKEIVMRAKLNIETSILRTLLFAEEQKTRQESRLQFSSGQNVFVLPSPPRRDNGLQRKALLELVQLVKLPTKRAVRAFKTHCEQQQAVVRYFGKVCANFQQKRAAALLTIRQLPPSGITAQARGQLAHSQLKLASRIVEGKYRDLLQHSFASIKGSSKRAALRQQAAARQIIAYSRIRKEQCLKEWLHIAKSSKLQSERKAAVNSEKRQALNRIVQRNYLKIFMEIARRLRTFQVAAYRIGCCSKINEQKSLWRLLAHMQHRLRQERQDQQQ